MRNIPVYLMIATALTLGCGPNTATSLRSPAPAATAVEFNVSGAPTIEFNAPDMMCPEGCGAKVKEILSELPGAKEVVINFEAKTATVAVDKDKFDAEAAIAALVDHGFENSTLKSDDAPVEADADPTGKPAS